MVSTGETVVVNTWTLTEKSAAFIAAGIYYINGFFVNVDAQEIVLENILTTQVFELV